MKKVAIPPMIADIIISGISNLNGFLFDAAEICPYCGGKLKGHDTKKKKFATIIENNQRKKIIVNVKRFRCTGCKKLVYASSPFYDNLRIGAPIVDFCILNLKIHPANHISKILKRMNILVSPPTIRSFSKINSDSIPSINFHGVLFPLSLLNISETIRNEENSGMNEMIIQMMQKKQN